MKRCVGLIVFEVWNACVNGDPDRDGCPRTRSDGRGTALDVSLKSKLRQLWTRHNTEYFQALVEQLGINPERFHICESWMHGVDTNDPVTARNAIVELSDNHAAFCDRLVDSRLFGTTFLPEGEDPEDETAEMPPSDDDNASADAAEKPKKGKGKKKKNGTSNGDKVRKHLGLKRTGPVTITHAISVSPVAIEENTITKTAPLRMTHVASQQGDMAPQAKKYVVHGVYVARIFVNPMFTQQTGCDEMDIEFFKVTLPDMFAMTTSASRPGGSINMIHIWWAEHQSILGDFNEMKFWESLTPTRKDGSNEPSTSLDDYIIPTPEIAKLPYKVIDLMNPRYKFTKSAVTK
jgi:CRISPR/Cas system type I-B associated protein Csh2 (Cas7 group RAMP superfamily)